MFEFARVFLSRAFLFTVAAVSGGFLRHVYRQLARQSAEQERHLKLFHRFNRELTRLVNLPDVLTLTVNTVLRELNCESAALFLYSQGRFRRQAIAGVAPQWFPDESYAPDEGITGQVAARSANAQIGNIVVDNSADQNPLIVVSNLDRYRTQLRSAQVVHLVAVPLVGAHRVFGILRVVNRLTPDRQISPAGFTEDDVSLLSTIASEVAVAISNIRREEKMQQIMALSQTLTQSGDQAMIFDQSVGGLVSEAMRYQAACLHLLMPNGTLQLMASRGMGTGVVRAKTVSIADAISERCLQDRSARQIRNLATADEFMHKEWAVRHGLVSMLCIPIVYDQQPLGVLRIFSGEEYTFYEEEIATLNAYASHLALLLQDARLATENHRRLLATTWQNERLAQLVDVLRRISRHDDAQGIFDQTVHSVAALLQAEDCSLFVVNEEENALQWAASHAVPRYFFASQFNPIQHGPRAGLPEHVAATREMLRFCKLDCQKHPAWNSDCTQHLTYLPSKSCESALFVPILTESKQTLGVLRVENKIGSEAAEGFTDYDQKILCLVASQVADALVGVQQIEKLSSLQQIMQDLTENLNLPRVLHRIAIAGHRILKADVVVICPYDRNHRQLLIDQAVTYGQRTAVQLSAKPRERGLTDQILFARRGLVAVENLPQRPEMSGEFTEAEGVQAFLGLPLQIRDEQVGIVYWDYRRPREFSDEEIQIARLFADQAALAISITNLFESMQRRVQELTATQQIREALLDHPELDRVLEVVLQVLQTTYGYEIATVSLVNEEEQTIRTVNGIGISEAWKEMAKHSLDSPDIQSEVVRTGKSVVIRGWDERLDREIYERFGHRELVRVFVPISAHGKRIGTIEAGYPLSWRTNIEEDEVRTLEHFVEQISIVIDNARLLERERRRAKQLTGLHAIACQIGWAVTEDELPQVLQLIAEKAQGVIGGGAQVVISAVDTSARMLMASAPGADDQLSASELIPERDAVTEQVMAQGEPIIATDAAQVDEWAKRVPISTELKAFACFPLKIERDCVGTLQVRYTRDHTITPQEIELLELAAADATLGILGVKSRGQLLNALDLLGKVMESSSHEILAPMAYIGNAVDVLVEGKLGPLNDKQVDRLLKLRRAVDRQTRLIRRVQEAGRLRDGQREPMFEAGLLGQVVEQIVESLCPLAESKHIALECDVTQFNAPAVFDRAMIEGIVFNLIDNALKFTPAGGAVRLRGEEDIDHFRLIVSDTGIGIEPQFHERIFDMYFQVSAQSGSRNGIGLGLYLVREYVKHHKGELQVQSALGQGSTFVVLLPKTLNRRED